MKYLYICMHNPFGKVGGGALASHAYMNAFAQNSNGLIDIICSIDLKDQWESFDNYVKIGDVFFAPERNCLKKIFSVFSGHLNRYISFTKKFLKKNKKKYDCVVFDHNSIAGPLVCYVKKMGIKAITIHHNYEYEYFKDNVKGIKQYLFLHHVVNNEKKAYCKSDLNLFLTRQDLEQFEKVYGPSDGYKAVLGAFEYEPCENQTLLITSQNIDCIRLSITGSLCSYQTVDGINYFFDALYSRVPCDCKIIISGRNPSSNLKKKCLSYTNVEMVEDPENMDEIIQKSDIYICPTRIGGGLKLRVMDGLKNGIPVLCHEKAARGFDDFIGQSFFKVFNSEKEFERCLVDIIDGVKKNKFNRDEIKKEFFNRFSFESGTSRLSVILKNAFK